MFLNSVCYSKKRSLWRKGSWATVDTKMSSEEFEKLHEIFKSLYDELKLIPERALRCHGGKRFMLFNQLMLTLANCVTKVINTGICVGFTEERKRLVRTFDERQGEADEVVSCSSVCVFWKQHPLAANFKSCLHYCSLLRTKVELKQFKMLTHISSY